MKTYRYIEIAPSRSAYDTIYLTFENIKTKEIIYRKALRWDLNKMNIYDEAIKRTEEIYKEYRCSVGIIENALERAKNVEELMLIYKQYYNGYLSPADQKRRQDLEKELGEMK